MTSSYLETIVLVLDGTCRCKSNGMQIIRDDQVIYKDFLFRLGKGCSCWMEGFVVRLSQLSIGDVPLGVDVDVEVEDRPGRKRTFRGRCRGRRNRAKTATRRGDEESPSLTSSLSLSLRVEKNMICLLLGRRVIKTLVRRTAGKHGAYLVDLVYKLARITLGKREAKQLMKRTLNIIAEVSVLTIHRKLSPHLLDLMRTALLTPLKTFQEMQNAQAEPLGLTSMTRTEQERRFTDSLHSAEKELFILLQPLVQERTLIRFVKVARTLRNPAIVRPCFFPEQGPGQAESQGLPEIKQLVSKMLATVGQMAEEQRGRGLERVSKSKSKKSRPRKSKKSKKVSKSN